MLYILWLVIFNLTQTNIALLIHKCTIITWDHSALGRWLQHWRRGGELGLRDRSRILSKCYPRSLENQLPHVFICHRGGVYFIDMLALFLNPDQPQIYFCLFINVWVQSRMISNFFTFSFFMLEVICLQFLLPKFDVEQCC